MSNRRILSRLPLEQPLLRDDVLEDTWAKWFTTISENTYKYDKYLVTLTIASVPANSTLEHTETIDGIASNDVVTVSKPTHTTGLGIVNVRVSAKNTVAITFMNTTGSNIVPPSEEYTIKVEKI